MSPGEPWMIRNRNGFRHALRMLFGLFWGLDAGLKLLPGTVFYFQERMISAGILQPAWLSGWFAFWLAQANAYGALDVALVATLEFFLAVALIAGLLRKTAYLGGIALSLFIWAIPEGFGGPYDPGTFDIGVGIVYAIGFLFLIALDSYPASNAHTLDEKIERRWPRWATVAEVSGAPTRSGIGTITGAAELAGTGAVERTSGGSATPEQDAKRSAVFQESMNGSESRSAPEEIPSDNPVGLGRWGDPGRGKRDRRLCRHDRFRPWLGRVPVRDGERSRRLRH